MELQNLPTGQQDFGIIREKNLLYVDKTPFIYRLLSEEKSFLFLSRPRRFGKSLFLNTLKAVFLGNKTLFEGLYIADKIDWEVRPVIHLDFSKMGFREIGLAKSIGIALGETAQSYGLALEKEGIAQQFQELILKLHAKTGKTVAILIDEYDKPITECLESGQEAEAQRDILRSFYGILKGNSGHIRMVFITGISRFVRVSLFSDMNNVSDLTFDEKYGAICGYTKEELESRFEPHLRSVAERRGLTYPQLLEEARLWYNGYSWDGTNRVYNPYSILRFLDMREFGNYWFESGTPKFLIKMLKPSFRYELQNTKVDMATFNAYDITDLNAETLLFQTGYLTVKEKDFAGRFQLGYPNKEVEQSMLRYLLIDYGQNARMSSIAIDFIDAVEEKDMEKFIETVNRLFADIPAEIFLQNKEAYFHSILYISLKLCGFHIQAEVRKSKGRIDALMRYENRLYFFEFKLDGTAEEALKQIEDRAYAKAYEGQGLEIHKIGISFSSETKEVGDWKEIKG